MKSSSIPQIQGKQEALEIVKEIINGRSILPADPDREDGGADTSVAPPQGILSNIDNSKTSVAR